MVWYGMVWYAMISYRVVCIGQQSVVPLQCWQASTSVVVGWVFLIVQTVFAVLALIPVLAAVAVAVGVVLVVVAVVVLVVPVVLDSLSIISIIIFVSFTRPPAKASRAVKELHQGEAWRRPTWRPTKEICSWKEISWKTSNFGHKRSNAGKIWRKIFFSVFFSCFFLSLAMFEVGVVISSPPWN